MAVKEWNDEIIFVRQVTPGASERSFGIQVARLAGLPEGVVGRAKQILATLEESDASATRETTTELQSSSQNDLSEPEDISPAPKPKVRRVPPRVDPSQLELF